jgi:hypothetical protein
MKIIIADDLGEHDHIGIPPGGLTGQVLKKIATTDHDVEWGYATGSGAAWGTITGTLSEQTDLQSALNGIHQLPAGGAEGDILTKASASDFDVEWAAGGAGGGLSQAQVLARMT